MHASRSLFAGVAAYLFATSAAAMIPNPHSALGDVWVCKTNTQFRCDATDCAFGQSPVSAVTLDLAAEIIRIEADTTVDRPASFLQVGARTFGTAGAAIIDNKLHPPISIAIRTNDGVYDFTMTIVDIDALSYAGTCIPQAPGGSGH
ncbi:MAG: hypothetical protein VCC99_17050 [Alphaproteobacteria bacterium]